MRIDLLNSGKITIFVFSTSYSVWNNSKKVNNLLRSKQEVTKKCLGRQKEYKVVLLLCIATTSTEIEVEFNFSFK